jgi:hypothetical protein
MLEYFMATLYILRPFGIFYGHLVHFSRFWYVVPRKIWQPCGISQGRFCSARNDLFCRKFIAHSKRESFADISLMESSRFPE